MKDSDIQLFWEAILPTQEYASLLHMKKKGPAACQYLQYLVIMATAMSCIGVFNVDVALWLLRYWYGIVGQTVI